MPLAVSSATGALIGIGAGAVVGSFIATLLLRWPAGRSVIGGRSRCDGCGRPLAPWDLVPIVSFAAVRGRCRACGNAIAPIHVGVEILCAAIGGIAGVVSPDAGGLALAVLGWQLLALGWLDARHMWLPHRLSAILALSGLVCGGAAMAALGLAVPVVDRLAGAVAGGALLWLVGLLYRRLRGRDGLGGGDPPMLGAIGAWTGWMALPLVLLLAATAGLAIATLRLASGSAGDWRTQRLPFGTLMALAVPAALLALRAMIGA